jgi:hypothetical protein
MGEGGGPGFELNGSAAPSTGPQRANCWPTRPWRCRSTRGVRSLRCVQLVEGFDHEPGLAEDANPLAMTGMELDPTARPLHSGHRILGRGRRSPACPPSSGTHTVTWTLLVGKTSPPPGLRSRAASGTERSGSHQTHAPYSLTARSKEPSGSGTSSAFASISANERPKRCWQRRAGWPAAQMSGPHRPVAHRAWPATPRHMRYRSRVR